MSEANAVEATKKKEPAPKIPVTMKDGRIVEFTERQKCLTRREGDALHFDFKSGDTIAVTAQDTAALAERFMWHGIEQKYRDEFASAGDASDAFEWVTALHERVRKGDWSEKREGGGMSGAGLLVLALVEITGQSATQIRTFLTDKSRKEQEIMRDYGPVAEKIKEIKARKGGDNTAAAATLFSALTAAPAA